ncbi:hypothetical protein [Cohnella terricola]|uniref:Uncharacterized protein n=1 Tax=Cohnella terricola TaxID=1289167 RepID=A0A559JDI3_9BACL|nr:hypothetical protein [Cohnella terricola]TVX97930.1 hypothetical protein FPZ45_16930 [Cohnella terricola]
MNLRKMGFWDKMIFILGLSLGGVIAFVLLVGVLVAVIRLYMTNETRSARKDSAPMLDDQPEMKLKPFGNGNE